MATYIILSNFTDQGVRTVKDTTKRSEAVRKAAKKFGATAKEIYWTLGACDVVAIFEAPDDESITGLALTLGSGGNVRTQVLRAFDKGQMDDILKKMA
jgi:uncharacterized protein with GYD domain